MAARYAVVLVLLALLGVLDAYDTYGHPAPDGTVVDATHRTEVSIVLTDKGFEPQLVRITKGTKVTFTTTRNHEFWPASDPHPSHIFYPEFDPKEPVSATGSWSLVFNKIGKWGFHDHIRSYFMGTIAVEQ